MTAPTHVLGEQLVRKWATRFGLGEFRITVLPLPPETPHAWALSFYDIEEMWGVIDLPADDAMPPALLELIVLHELAHGLLALAKSGDVDEEQSCNRIARLAKGDFDTHLANEDAARRLGEQFYEQENSLKSMYPRPGAVDRRAWLPIVTDALPERERQVITLLYWEGLSYSEAAEQMGVPIRSLRRWRESALLKLGENFVKLEGANWSTARRIIPLKMPEGGSEHAVIYELHHRCGPANALIRTEVGTEDMDLLVFPVGNVGYGMPLGIPFGVQALGACQACGSDVGVYFVWQAGSTNHPGSLWTPA